MTKGELVDLHHTKKMSLTEISKLYGVGRSTISRWLRKFDVESINHTISYISKGELVDLHHTKKMSLTEISTQLNMDRSVIARNLKLYNIELMNYQYIELNRDMLIDLHHTKKMSIFEISKSLNTTSNRVKRNLIKYDIEIKYNSRLDITKECLVDLNVNQLKSLTEIADYLNTSKSNISKYFKKFNINVVEHRCITISKDDLVRLHHIDKKTLFEIADIYDCDPTTIANKCRQYFIDIKYFKITSQHNKIKQLLDDNNIGYLDNCRNIITPFELDIYIPSHKLAIELNGVYWHSEKFKDKDYHYNKYLACKERGIKLIQIWEDDFNQHPEKIIKYIKYKLGLITERVYARKTNVVNIPNKLASEFHDINHIQGKCSHSFSLGLYHNQDLVAVCSFKRTGDDLDLVRYSTSINVVGGFTKLLSYLDKNIYYSNLITFADLCISNGNLYDISGFEVDKILKPDYKYLVGGVRKHKFGFRKNRFKSNDDLKYEDGLTEFELAKLNGLLRIYDAGKLKYIKKGQLSPLIDKYTP